MNFSGEIELVTDAVPSGQIVRFNWKMVGAV
jgi:hypothetical protein